VAKTLRAKFTCWHVAGDQYGENVELSAVYSDDPKDPNHSWSQATPSGTLTMFISNPEARGVFEQGKEYYLDIAEATPEEVAPPAD